MTEEIKLTPMMKQYRQAKSELQDDVLLLFRMGDFYEIFFEDAVIGAQAMDITLTKRGGVPMAGIPHHALENYIPRILEQGIKVAIAEQMEDPKQAKGIVKREITQIITPGTIVEGHILKDNQSNYLAALVRNKKGQFGLASLDISTADFKLTEVQDLQHLEAELNRLKPAECILTETLKDSLQEDGFLEAFQQIVWTQLDTWIFDKDIAAENLCKQFGVKTLDGFGCREFSIGIQAAGAIMHYATNNLRRDAAHITQLSPYYTNQFMLLDRMTQRNLELVDPLYAENKKSTLFHVLNQTSTPMGSRMLRDWILRPLTQVQQLKARQQAVAIFVEDYMLLQELQEALRSVRDIERVIAKLNVGSANGRDLLILNRALSAIPDVKAILQTVTDSELLNQLETKLADLPDVTNLIDHAICDEPPVTVKDGGVIREGYNEYLDDLRSGATEGKRWLAELQAREQDKTGIKSLKVKYNKVFGYFIEVSKSNVDLVPEEYLRKQTLVNAERYITPELKEIEDKVLGAEDKSKALEYEIFQQIREQVISNTSLIQSTAFAISQIDVLGSFAETALKNDFCCPDLVEESILEIEDARHPVVEALMQEERFIPNDTQLNLDDQRLMIITGPNMAGKSTYIRQVAILTLMAHIGSYIPASSAKIGMTDRIFTRVGAADDLSRGQSTFMVEMLETANILNNATNKSLVILDEIGRGTSTYDGLSLAWSITEFLYHERFCRTLFATHYHELTDLSKLLPGVYNANVAVKEAGEDIVFLHKIMAGPADKSYGIHVAKLAGIPEKVLKRSQGILRTLESNQVNVGSKKKKNKDASPNQLTLFDLLSSQ